MNLLKLKISYLVLFTIISLIFFIFLDFTKEKSLNNFLEMQTMEAKEKYDGMSLVPRDISNLIFANLINKPNVIDIFKDAYNANESEKNKIRDRLYKHLENTYKDLKKYNVQQLHFHLPNNHSFLRFHRPQKFGDDLTLARETVAHTNKYKVAVEGFEEGKIFNGYRFVYPLFDKENNHIGSVEVSHSIKSFKSMFQRSFNNLTLDIVLIKSIVIEKVFKNEMKNYREYVINKDFFYQNKMKISEHVLEINSNLKNKKEIQIKMQKFENFSTYARHGNHYDIISFIAIKNSIGKNNVAYAISFQRSEYLDYFFKENFYYKIICLVNCSSSVNFCFRG